jgi:Carboxypeptidase regulatory-like domain
MNVLRFVALALVTSLAQSALAVAGDGALFGDVIDGETGDAVAGVLVTAKSPALQGALTAFSDANGRYRIDALPPGTYVLSFAKDGFVAEPISGIRMRANATLRFDAVVYKEASAVAAESGARADIVKVTAAAPVVDVCSTQTGAVIDSELLRRVPIGAPQSRGGAVRSFETAAVVAPQVQNDSYGASINGATSPENQYVIEGISVNNTAYGYNGTPLSIEFVDEISVITGGYLPEYGRSMGGLLDVTTKSGSNELHGSVFGTLSPGFLEGARAIPPNEGSAIRVQQQLNYTGDVGFEVGGPILQDRLWFFVGGTLARQSIFLNRQLFSQAGQALPGTQDQYEAESTSLQGIAKLTWLLNDNNRVSFTVFGTPTVSGGYGKYGINPETGRPESMRLEGEYGALAHIYRSGALDAIVKWDLALLDRRLRFDTSLGWHHEASGRMPSDGSQIGDSTGLAALPRVEYRRSIPFPRSITDVETVPGSAGCDATNEDGSPACPITSYSAGGPDFINDALHDSIQVREVATYLLDFFGLHVIKAGVNVGYSTYDNLRTYSGGRRYLEDEESTYWQDHAQYGSLTGPDDASLALQYQWRTTSVFAGAFVQDSWTAFDIVTLNLGLRWDNEWLLAGDNSVGLALPNQISPRAGIILDPFQSGRMKLYGSYARYYQSVPLDLADRASSSEPQVVSLRSQADCDPTTAAQKGCVDADKLTVNDVDQPDQKWYAVGMGRTAVDPQLQPASSDEIVVGAEAEIFRDARVGLSYTKRWINVAIEDMSRDEANTYFIGNPGFGIASDFDKATRDYDGLTFQFYKQWSEGWIAQASYTLSYLRGNYAGLFRPETEQLNPNINSDFDLKSLTVNRTGALPFDRNHQFKLYGARQFDTAQDTHFTLGFSGSAMSGAPISYLASHQIYGEDEVFVLPRGAGGRTEWIFSGDVHGGFTFEVIKGQPVELTVDVFNLLNLQGALDVDETWSDADVTPLVGCDRSADTVASCTVADLRRAKSPEGAPIPDSSVNKNHGEAEQFQLPRTVRFGLRWSF